MGYVALYRKWRPNNFETLIGQDHIRKALSNALDTKRISHAYLFTGPRGTGKTSTARILAKALNCENGPTQNPCNKCENCKRAELGNSMDIIEIDAASNRGIDEIRQLREKVNFAPVNSRFKVYIIDEVHMITVDAFNALLKTLEEPPEHVVFILATTEPQKIPATIHSRCQRFDFRRVNVEDIQNHLAEVAKGSDIQVDDDALKLIALQAEGGMRDALSLLDQCSVMDKHITQNVVRNVLGIVGREALRELAHSIGEKDLSSSLKQLNTLSNEGKDLKQIIVELSEYLRAILLYKVTPDYEEIFLTDDKESIEKVAALYSQDRLIAAEQRLHEAMLELRQTICARVNVELCLVDLCKVSGNTLEALVARIESLEKELAYVKKSGIKSQPDLKEDFSSQVIARKEVKENAQNSQKLRTFSSAIKNASIQKDENREKSVEPKIDTRKVSPKIVEDVLESQKEEKRTHLFENLKCNCKEETKSLGDDESTSLPTGDLKRAQEIWKNILDVVKAERKMAINACGTTGRPTAYHEGTLVVAFRSKTFSERMSKEDYNKVIEEAAFKVTGEKLRLRYIVQKKSEQCLKNTKNLKQDTTKSSLNKMERVENLPLNECNCLQKALKVFGGTVKKM